MKLNLIYCLLLWCAVCSAQSDSLTPKYNIEDSSRIKLVRLSVNSPKSDFSPIVCDNSLLFVSARYKNTGVKYSAANDAADLTDIYMANKKDSVTFKKLEGLPDQINSKFSEGPFTISSDGNTIYFTGNIKTKKSKTNSGGLTIYKSKKENGNWSEPVVAEFCTEDASYGHPALSADEKSLFFCSTLSGGFGGMDIYVTRLVNDSWTKPLNLGSKVNSASNEVFPFISKNNVLYFSANRSTGIGGLDIYSLDMSDPIDNEVKLVEYPINSHLDDFGIWTDSLGASGYFSTNRVKANDDDIYYFDTHIPDFRNASTPTFKTKFCYTFYEETALEIGDTTSLSYEWDFGDGFKSRQLTSRHCFNKPGQYSINLNAVEKATGEVFANQLSYQLDIEEPPKLFIACADTLTANKEITLSSQKCAIKGYTIADTYWYFGDGKYNEGKDVKHNYLKPGQYTILLGVTATNNETQKREQFKIEKQITVTDKLNGL